ncbi:MAG: dihydroneopterin aldolase [Rikenellaceae bacterium]|nr:dihydroneopterin aldolase [Rikenellaceae bacterium]
MKKGIIEIEGMEFYAYHGCYDTEQIVGNEFTVDLKIEADITVAAETDDIYTTINYLEVYNTVAEQMGIKSRILENVASRIVDSIYERFPGVESVTVKVSKKYPPLGGKVRKTSVTLSC